MCDPVSIGYAVVAVGTVVAADDSSRKAKHAAEDQARAAQGERAAQQAQAIQSANAKLAADNRRRREQKSLLARGSPQPTMGDESGDGNLIAPGRGLMSRSLNSVITQSMLSRGAPAVDGRSTRPRTPTREGSI